MDRNISDAIGIAENALDYFFNSTKSTYSKPRLIDLNNIKYYVRPSVKSNESNDTLMYIVNFKDNMGFAIVPKNNNAPKIIAITEYGNYDGANLGVHGFDMYMENISTYLATLPPNSGDIDIQAWEYKDEVEESSSGTEPLVAAKWGQEGVFNKYCPIDKGALTPTGCVATAIAMAMSAFKYPSSISLTFSNAPVLETPLSWDNMISNEHSVEHSETCVYCDQNALLQREIGHRVYMNYKSNDDGGSGADTKKYAAPCLESFGYHTNKCVDYNLSDILGSLDENCPVIIRGKRADGEGHAWIVDGYKYFNKKTDTYRRDQYNFIPWEHCNYLIEKVWYLHFNYGYYGASNGYFLSQKYTKAEGVLTVGGYIESYDVKMFQDSKKFNQDVKIISNIYPNL